MLKIEKIAPDSVGEELGLKPGDVVTEFDGYPAEDIMDYVYYDAATAFTMTVESGGEVVEYEVEKDEAEPLGLDFGEAGELSPACCKNNCVFCFVRQLPKGMRDSLYVKDDDWRFSVISGNFVTLTNVSEAEFQRILRLQAGPLYISVHATDPALRVKLLKNPTAGDILPRMRRLNDAGISMHCQIVLCPGWNDGAALTRTLADLAELPAVLSCAIVPVGLTGHREGLSALRPVEKADALAAIDAEREANELRPERFVWCSDEMYLKAGEPLPLYAEYGDFCQLENGVGLVAKFEAEFYGAPLTVKRCARTVTLITGVSAREIIERAARTLTKRVQGLTVNVEAVENRFFGSSVTVAGLLTCRDIAKSLAGKPLGDFAVISRVMLREFETVFLDGPSVEDLAARLGVPVRVCGMDGEDLIETILGD